MKRCLGVLLIVVAMTVLAVRPVGAEEKPSALSLSGLWKTEVSGRWGMLEFSEKNGTWTASLKLEENGKWELLENVLYDAEKREVRFYRPFMDQSFSGILQGDDLAGAFWGERKFSRAWKAVRKIKAAAAPVVPVAPLVGTWKIEANTGALGVAEFSGHGKSWSGRLRLDTTGRWETLENVTYDQKAGELSFNRPLLQQKFRGFLRGKRISGTFKFHGIISPWKATKK